MPSGWRTAWSRPGDRDVVPVAENHEFIVPPDRPFLDSLTCLAYLAGCTEMISSASACSSCRTGIRSTGRGSPRRSSRFRRDD